MARRHTPFRILIWMLMALQIVATPQIALPVNAQVPPVARVSQVYQFQFASTTFISPPRDGLSYSISGAPAWLVLDSTTRTFSGTPAMQDLGPVTFQLSASDNSGSTAMSVTLIVVDTAAPQLDVDLSDQLSKFGSRSDNTSLEFYGNQAFNVAFGQQIFQGANNLTFYATSSNGSPLPSWLEFNGINVMFSGLTPFPVTSPEIFGVKLSATTIPGFSEASITFSFVISDHELLFVPFEQHINVSSDTSVTFTNLRNQLLLDSLPIKNSSISSAIADIPSWMQFNPETLAITGVPPPGTTSQDVMVNVDDIYGDTATTLLHFLFDSRVFAGQIGVLDATAGRNFTYQIKRSLFVNQDAQVVVNLGPASSWLHFDSNNLTLHGLVPPTPHGSELNFSITATLPSGTVSETQDFELRIAAASASTTTSAAVSQPLIPSAVVATSAATSSSLVNLTSSTSTASNLSPGLIAAIIVVSVVGIAAFSLLFFLLLRRRKSKNGDWASKTSSSSKRSRKFKESLRNRNIFRTDRDIEAITHPAGQSPISRPPQITGDIPGLGHSIRSSKYRYSTESVLKSLGIVTSPNNGKQQIREDRMKAAEKDDYSAMIREKRMTIPAVPKSLSKRLSRLSERSSGLPIERRLTGIGHGRSSYASQSRIFGSLRRSHGPDSSSMLSQTTLSTQMKMDSFPFTQGIRSNPRLASSDAERHWIRRVPEDVNEDDSSGSGIVADPRSIDEKRQSFIRRRASSARSSTPFFGGSGDLVSQAQRRRRVGKRSTNSRRQDLQSGSNLSRSSSAIIHPLERFPRVVSGQTLDSVAASDDWETEQAYSLHSGGDDYIEEEDELDDEELYEGNSTGTVHTLAKRSKWAQRLDTGSMGDTDSPGAMRTPSAGRGMTTAGQQQARSRASQVGRTPSKTLANRPLRSQLADSRIMKRFSHRTSGEHGALSSSMGFSERFQTGAEDDGPAFL